MKLKKRIILFSNLFFLSLFLTILNPRYGQAGSTTTLSQRLWEKVKNCYVNFVDESGDGKPEIEIIDDSKNGYLHISGSYSTCGCSCSSTVGAFKSSKGDYIFLQAESFKCMWAKRILASKNLKDILPRDFGLNTFTTKPINAKFGHPIFFINFEIPRYGTDTKVKIELVPLGLEPEGKDLICFEYREEKYAKNCNSLYRISYIARYMKDEKTLKYIREGNFSKISKEDKKLIEEAIGNDESRLKSKKELQKNVNKLYQIYSIYQNLEATEVVLGWSKKNSRFYIKGKKGRPDTISFREFLTKSEFWSPMC